MLESASLSLVSLGLMCSFTVVSNCFIGLECTEHTCYDLIIAKKETNRKLQCQQDLSVFDMLKVLRNVGVDIPIILLFDASDKSDTLSKCLEMEASMEENCLSFCCAISKPFSSNDLATSIKLALGTQNQNQIYMAQGNKMTELTSSVEALVARAALRSNKDFNDHFRDVSFDVLVELSK